MMCSGLDTDSPGHATLCYKLGDNTGQGLWQLTFIPTKYDSNDMYEKISGRKYMAYLVGRHVAGLKERV